MKIINHYVKSWILKKVKYKFYKTIQQGLSKAQDIHVLKLNK